MRWLLVWAGLLVLAYLGGFVYVWLVQDRAIFKVRPLSPEQAQEVAAAFPAARSVRLAAADGTPLHARYLPASRPVSPRSVVLYFGGNSEQVHWMLAQRAAFDGWDLLLVDYRGYGLSGGQPSQAAFEDDASRWLQLARNGSDGMPRADRLVVMGTSMGSYLAAQLAASHPVEGIVMVVPYDSAIDIVQSMIPIYPIGWIVKHRFETIAHAPKVRAPTIFFVASHDTFVTRERSSRLYAAWASPSRQWVELANANHHTVVTDPLFWQRLGEFLRAR